MEQYSDCQRNCLKHLVSQDILTNIFLFDNTYREIYSNCIIALTYKGPAKFLFYLILKPKWYNKNLLN
jgi:hypothetical protein